jgi:hypothetical protein
MSGPELLHIGRKEGGISSAVNHRLDYVAQAAQHSRRQAMLRMCQIGLDDFHRASVREVPNGPHHARVSREVFAGACDGDHRAIGSEQVAQYLATDETCSPGDQNRRRSTDWWHSAIPLPRCATGLVRVAM